jgi:hypothetical protein
VIHLNHCSVHASPASTNWLEEHTMRGMLHRFYSYDLALSDFDLFLTMKEELEQVQMLTTTSLLILAKDCEEYRSRRIE